MDHAWERKRFSSTRWDSRIAIICTLVVTACLCLFPSVPLIHSQGIHSPPQTTPTIRSRVQLVLLDVVVTDRNGQPVTGLGKDDFEVLERTDLRIRGQKQNLLSFEEHKSRAAIRPSALNLPPHVYTNEPLVSNADSVNVLLLDALNTPLGDQPTVRKQMIDYLKNIEPGPRLAIVTLSSQLRLVEGFTADPHALIAALNKEKGEGITQPSDLRTAAEDDMEKRPAEMMGEVAQVAGDGSIASAIASLQSFQAETKATERALRFGHTLDALRQLASYLSGYPGRKNIIWVSGSFPAVDLLNADDRDLSGAVKQTVNILASAQVAIYPVAAQGLDTDSLYQAQASRFSALSPASPGTPMSQRAIEGQTQTLNRDSDSRALDYATMDDLARNTGGKAFYNTNGLKEALADAVHTGSYYYRVSYSPSDKIMLGRYRHTEVKLRNGRYTLSYRRGYYEEKDTKDGSDESSASLDHLRPMMTRGLPEGTQIVYRLRTSPLAPQPASYTPIAGDNKELRGPVTRLSADFVLPLNELTLDPADDGILHGNLELGIVAYDHDGKPLNWLFRLIRPSLKPELYPQVVNSGAHFHQEIDVPQADVYLHAGVYDVASNKAGTLEIKMSKADLAADVSAEDLFELLSSLPPKGSRNPLIETPPPSGFEAEDADHPTESASASAGPIDNRRDAATEGVNRFQNGSDLAGYCEDIAGAVEHAPALAKTCEFALSIRQKLPDILCDREMKRSWSEIALSQGGVVELRHSDVVTAKLRYTSGQEHYEDIRINGKIVNANAPQLSGTWSDGEFATVLADIFMQSARTTFRFEKETTLRSRKSLMFGYRVEAKNNRSYFLQVDQKFWFPTYGGHLWVDEQNLQLLRLERETVYMPSEPIRRMNSVIEYADLSMGDKTSLLLPLKSNVLICMPPPMSSLGDICSHHSIKFTNWHKFRGTARILTDPAN